MNHQHATTCSNNNKPLVSFRKIKTTQLTLIAALASASMLIGCGGNPADETYTTEATEAKPETKPEATSENAALATIALTGENTQIQWTGSKPTGSHDGGFKNIEGTLTANEDKSDILAIDATIHIDSMYSDSDGLTKHLLNEDFFNQPEFPKSTFVTTQIAPVSATDATGEVEGATHMVTGNFTLRGNTRSITFPAVVESNEKTLGLKTVFDINRSQFDMNYGLADAAINDEVVIRLDIQISK